MLVGICFVWHTDEHSVALCCQLGGVVNIGCLFVLMLLVDIGALPAKRESTEGLVPQEPEQKVKLAKQNEL